VLKRSIDAPHITNRLNNLMVEYSSHTRPSSSLPAKYF
jgi:hypothetical protein